MAGRAPAGLASPRQGPLRTSTRAAADRPVLAGLIALLLWACFALARLYIAAGGNVTRFVRAAMPYSHPGRVPAGMFVFPTNGYDGQFFYRLALDPADLHRTAFGITMDAPYRLQRIGYPALAWLVSLGQHAWVPVTLVVVNVLALGAIALTGGVIAREGGRHALWGLLLAGYFGFFMSVGNDLAEPTAAACMLGGVLAYRRRHPVLAGALFGYAALTRESMVAIPAALAAVRVIELTRRRARPSATDLAWLLPLATFAAWQAVLRLATGTFVLLTSVSDNTGSGVPFGEFAGALRMNAGLLVPPTGAAYIWFLELATLCAFAAAALRGLRSAPVPAYERVAFVVFILELGALSGAIWSGHADLRSINEVYLFAVLVLLGSRHRRLVMLTACLGVAVIVAATHQALHLS